MTTKLDFSVDEFSLLSNSDIIFQKREIQNKIYKLLEQTQFKISNVLIDFDDSLPIYNHAKISKGENYLNLPYMVLDYPSVFSNQNIFAFRTMFYWGNFFSNTLHLEGEYLQKNRQKIYSNSDLLIESNTYISTGETPWHYHFDDNNYLPLTKENSTKLLSDKFIKLSTKIDLDKWHKLPDISADYLRRLLLIIVNK